MGESGTGQALFQLPEQAKYFPVKGSFYQVEAGLHPLGTDFGNGRLDHQIIQLNNFYIRYRANKLACRAERLAKYYATHDLASERRAACCLRILQVLLEEHPSFFSWEGRSSRSGKLLCHLTQEELFFEDGVLVKQVANVVPPYVDGFDALACQIPEDLAVVCREGTRDWLGAIHLCAAGHWAAEGKIGKDFSEVHSPVPGIAGITRAARAMVHAMIQKGPFVRFVWGFGSDDRLNHHPDPPPGWEISEWRGRSFQNVPAGECPFFLRVERQVTLGLAESDAALFFIHVSYWDGREIRDDVAKREKLLQVLKTMDEPSRAYKGLTESMDPLVRWLSQGA